MFSSSGFKADAAGFCGIIYPTMTGWKAVVSIAAGVLLLACLLLFVRSLNKPDPAAMLTAKLEKVVSDWAANRVPVNERVINLIIGDAGAEVLSLVPQDKAVTWTLDGYSKAQEKEVIEVLARSIVKAHDFGAVLNIVAQGEVGAAVLKSVKSLEGQMRGGAQVGVHGLAILGMDARRLKAYDPGYFEKVVRPLNVGEWANIYTTTPSGGMRLEDSGIEMYSAKYDRVRVPGRFLADLLAPESRASPLDVPIRLDTLARAIIGVFGREGGLEDWITQQQRLEEEQAEELRRRASEGEAERRAEEEARRREDAKARRKAAIQWVNIPGRSFMMGSEGGMPEEKPRRRVTVRTFQMAKTEVTRGQYQACVDVGACSPPDPSCKRAGDDHPVSCVDWDQAAAFSEWAGGRLPSEAEWEYAARSAGRDIEYPWGNAKATCSRAVIDEGARGCGRVSAWPVCSKPAGNTKQGLCDMAGNVWEWVQDWYHGSYDGAPENGSAWESPAGSHRILRGGSWPNVAGFARTSPRHYVPPNTSGNSVGFRPARDLPKE